MNINEEDLKNSIREIEKLNPKPGAAFSEPNKINSSIIPDFTIDIIENNYFSASAVYSRLLIDVSSS